MAKFKNFRKKPFGRRYVGRKNARMSATQKAYLAGVRRGKAIARARSHKRWYRWSQLKSLRLTT